MNEKASKKSIDDVITSLKTHAFSGIEREDIHWRSINDKIELAGRDNDSRKQIIDETQKVLDECIGWISDVTDTMLVIVLESKRKKKKWKALLFILSNIVSQMISIRKLVDSGLDVPAKQLLRCCSEHVDLAIFMNVDDNLVNAFLRFKNIDGRLGAKEFWNKHLRNRSMSKIKSKMHLEIESRLGKKGNCSPRG